MTLAKVKSPQLQFYSSKVCERLMYVPNVRVRVCVHVQVLACVCVSKAEFRLQDSVKIYFIIIMSARFLLVVNNYIMTSVISFVTDKVTLLINLGILIGELWSHYLLFAPT